MSSGSLLHLFVCSSAATASSAAESGPISVAAVSVLLNSPTRLAIDNSLPKLCGTQPSSRTPVAQTSALAPYPSISDTITNRSRFVPEKPHQPQKHTFPKQKFGKTVIVEYSFQPSWSDKWPWLPYNEEHDIVLSHICLKAKEEKKIMWSNSAEEAFMGKGITKWKDASAKFDKHSGSSVVGSCRKEALLKIWEVPSTTKDIGESLSEQHSRERLDRRQCLMKLLSNARFLARQGLPFQGHDESSSNFHQLLILRGDDERVATWVQKKMDKYTSPDIQSEMLDVIALKVLHTIVSNIQAAPFSQ